MIATEERVDFLKALIRRRRKAVVRLLQAQEALKGGLARGVPAAEQYRECAMPDEVWRWVKPVADLLYRGQWVSAAQYALVRDALLDHADEFAALLEHDVDTWMAEADAGMDESET